MFSSLYYALATKPLGIGMSVCLSVGWFWHNFQKKVGWHRARSILYRLCTLGGALAQYIFIHSHGQNTVKNRARILAWALTFICCQAMIGNDIHHWHYGQWIRSKKFSTKTFPAGAYSCLQVCVIRYGLLMLTEKRKRLFTDTVSMNKMHLTDTVPVNKIHLTDTVPVNKMHLTDTVSVNKMHLTGTV